MEHGRNCLLAPGMSCARRYPNGPIHSSRIEETGGGFSDPFAAAGGDGSTTRTKSQAKHKEATPRHCFEGKTAFHLHVEVVVEVKLLADGRGELFEFQQNLQ